MAVIPARGGSKAIPDKNIRDLAGKPLIAWSIEEVHKSKYIDRLVVSSDSQTIIDIAQKYGCEVPFKRPSQLAQDDVPGVVPLLHTIETLPDKYNYAVLLQCTSPFRTVDDIDGAVALCIDKGVSSCISVCESKHNPHRILTISDDGSIMASVESDKLFLPRQKLPKVYEINGAVYVISAEAVTMTRRLLNVDTIAYIMSKDRSLDIDDVMDFHLAETIIKNRSNCE